MTKLSAGMEILIYNLSDWSTSLRLMRSFSLCACSRKITKIAILKRFNEPTVLFRRKIKLVLKLLKIPFRQWDFFTRNLRLRLKSMNIVFIVNLFLKNVYLKKLDVDKCDAHCRDKFLEQCNKPCWNHLRTRNIIFLVI